MKANTRQMPGSTRSCCTALRRSAPPAWRLETSGESTYKTQTKCRQNRECDFFNSVLSVTYNFNAVKCLNFLGRPARNDNPTLNPRWFGGSPASPCLPFSRSADLALRVFASLRLCVEFPVAAKPDMLDKMRLLRLRLSAILGVFRTNRTTILRLVSFCPVLPAAAPHSCQLVLIRGYRKWEKTRQIPKHQNHTRCTRHHPLCSLTT
jgi:hypothetical protein